MRALFVPREDSNRIFGGDVVQMQATARCLKMLGVEVDIGPPDSAISHTYDIVHLWTSLHFPHMLEPQLAVLEPVRSRSKVVLSTIWAPHHLVLWMDAARRWLFTSHPNPAALSLTTAQEQLKAIADRALDFTVEGKTRTAFSHHPMVVECREVLRRVDMILPNSWMELSAIFAYLGDFTAYGVVPNAVDAAYFSEGNPKEIPAELHGLEFALMSARFDTRKQQDFAILALKDLDVPLVFVGERTDPEIFARFQAIGSTRKAPVYYYPFIPQEQLRHLYAAARVHFLPSLFESPGLSSLEAALLDCSVVVGNLAFECEYFQDSAYYCDPCNAHSIARAVEGAIGNYHRDADRREKLRKRIETEYTWEAAAHDTMRAYEALLA